MVWDVVHPTSCSTLVYVAYKPWTYPQQNHDKPHINQLGKQTHQKNLKRSVGVHHHQSIGFPIDFPYFLMVLWRCATAMPMAPEAPEAPAWWPCKDPRATSSPSLVDNCQKTCHRRRVAKGVDPIFLSMGCNDKRGESTMEQTILIWYII